jgi:uncharacterized protein (DUF1501 family)
MTIQGSSRRSFLGYGMGVVGIGGVLPGYLVRTALAGPAAEAGQRVLVVLQLSGGNDALSMVVPHGHAEYAKVRQTTRIQDDEVIKINNELGLHPNLKGLKELMDQGVLAALPGVGYPKPNLSHFHSQDIWHTADYRGRNARYGWLGKAIDVGFPGNPDPLLSIAVGVGSTPLAMEGKEHLGVSLQTPESFRFVGDRGDERRAAAYRKMQELATRREQRLSELGFVSQTAAVANTSSDKIRQRAEEYKPTVEYPQTALGRQLQSIAALIVGGLTTRIFFTTHPGGFDTHANQRPHHDRLMGELNAALVAFYKDLECQKQAHRVLLMTTSEFGRTVKENGTQGTDHGTAASMLMLSPGVKAGICGKHPSLSDVTGGGGNWLKHTHDFRGVYASVLEKWLKIPSGPVLGEKFDPVDCIA